MIKVIFLYGFLRLKPLSCLWPHGNGVQKSSQLGNVMPSRLFYCSQIFKTVHGKTHCFLFSQSVSLTQYVVLSVRHPVCPPVCPFQLASESSRYVVDRRRSDYCPRGAIFLQHFGFGDPPRTGCPQNVLV